MRTAPSPKFGAISAPTFGLAASHDLTFSNFALSKPVVPTTTLIPFFIANSRLPITESGWVKSTTT